jgi:hypothetical protein
VIAALGGSASNQLPMELAGLFSNESSLS